MALQYDQFYQKYGVRQSTQLLTPRLPHLVTLELPQRSVYHYVGRDSLDEGPAMDEYLFRHITRPIPMMHVTKLLEAKGNPRPITQPIAQEIRQYHNKHRRYRQAPNVASGTRDALVPLVVNYAWLGKLYRYQRNTFAEYNRWWNINATVWKKIAEYAEETDRHQFIEVKLPKLLPGLTDLRIAAECLVDGDGATSITPRLVAAMEEMQEDYRPRLNGVGALGMALEAMNSRTLRIFNTPESLVLLELWKWVGPQRAKSALNVIPDAYLDRVNLIIVEAGRWMVLNLGVLNRWREATEEELKANPNANQKGMTPLNFQKHVLRMVMAVFQVRSDATAADASMRDEADTKAPVKDVPNADKPKTDTATVSPVPTPVEVTPANAVGQAINTPTPAPETVEVAATPQVEPQAVDADEVRDDPALDAKIEADLAELDRITQAHLQQQEEQEDAATHIVTERTPEASVMAAADRLAEQGMMSGAEYRRMQELAIKYKTLKAPDGKRTLAEFVEVTPEQVKITESRAIPDIPTVLDKSMLRSSLHDFDSRYIRDVMPRDTARMALAIQHAGIAVTDYQVERVENVMGAYDMHTLRVTPVEGAASTLHFRLPAVDEDGTFVTNGIKYQMRKQKGDLPIRKVGPDRVALTSYYGKTFITRSTKKVNDYGAWVRNQIMAKGLAKDDPNVTSIHPLDCFDREFECPRLYSQLAMGFREFTTPEFTFMLDHRLREATFGKDAVAQWERDGARLIAFNAKREYLLIDRQDALYKVVNGALQEHPSLEETLGLPLDKAPIDLVEMKIMGQTIPVGFVLAYEIGLSSLCRLLKVQPRIVPAGTRLHLDVSEYPIIFEDETWVFSRDNQLASLLLAGFNEYSRSMRDYASHLFDRKDVYLNLLETQGASVRYIREIDLMYQMFVDPITKHLLEEMREPTDFRGLLLRATTLLLNDKHPSELDSAYMRAKGYERMPGAVYQELVKAVRAHNGRPGKSKHPIELKPFAVWTAIQTDPAQGLVKDINPIQNLKEKEAMTYSGTGGRSSRSMTKRTRAYHRNDMGVTSESTVDSGDVGINVYTSADPQFNSLYGTAKPYEIGKTGATALFSTSALLAPGSDRDDPKRVNFVAIQQGHQISCKGYGAAAVRTGYEQVVAHRTSDLYATTAKQDGRVVSVSKDGILVEFKDGTKKGIQTGRRYGQAEGLTIPHEVVTELEAGDEFKAGDILAYNSGFFKRDMLNPKQVVLKSGLLARTVLMESAITLEDSSAISKRISEQLTTSITKVKTIVVRFDQTIHQLVKPGQGVGSEDILCVIEDAITYDNQLFDKDSLDTLKILSANSPQAGFKGVVERVEVYYHGDLEDMSPSMRELATASDRELMRRHRAIGGKGFTGQVDEGFRVDGTPLSLDTIAIQVYITADVGMGVGDKGVFANQMKTVIGKVLEGEWRTESGLSIDAVFGAKSIGDRIVTSPYVIGTTTSLLQWIGQNAATIYQGGTAK